MLGLNGMVVKSHGGTDAQGFAHALDVAMDMVVHRFNDQIRDGLAKIRRPGIPESECQPFLQKIDLHKPGHAGIGNAAGTG